MPPQARGRIAYNDTMDGFNFVTNRLPVSAILEQLSRYALFEDPPVRCRAERADCGLPAGLCRGKQTCRSSIRRSRRGSGSAIASRCRPTSTNRTMSPAWSRAGAGSRCFRRSRLPTSISDRSTIAPTGAAMSMVRPRRSGLRKISEVQGCARRGLCRGARPRRCAFHSDPVVAPRGVARPEAQRSGQLLVERRARHGREDGIGDGLPPALPAEHQADAGRAPARLGQPVPSLRLRRKRRRSRAHTGRTGAACWRRLSPEAARRIRES